MSPSFLRQVALIVAKDLRIEWRSREIIYTMVLFSVLLAVTFAFAFGDDEGAPSAYAGGVVWVSVAFTGVLGLGRIFERERDGETFSALLLCPTSRIAIYLGKLLGTLVYMSLTEIIVVPLVIVLFNLQLQAPGTLIALVALGTIGFAAVGALFAAALSRARGREILLAVLTFPLVTPIIAAGAKGTAALLTVPPDMAVASLWLKLLVAFDVLFLFVSMLAFEPLVTSD